MFGAHAFPHAPQLVTADSEASQPSAGLALQSANPTAQAHAPPLQICCAPQATLQDPQCAASVAGSISHPVATRPSQSRSPAGHWQLPPTHDAPSGQATPQPPQLVGSVAGTTSQPFDGIWSQSR
jgi:hypothetical protein